MTTVTTIPCLPLKIADYPGKNSVALTAEGKEIKLIDLIGSGNEGFIYHTNIPNTVAKIYKPNIATKRHQIKFELLAKISLSQTNICLPQMALYNKYKQFVGFLMPEGKGKTLQFIVTQQLRSKHFPSWSEKDFIMAIITILEQIIVLHKVGILLGDISLKNFLVSSPTEIYFVDCDSYQYDIYPCPVGELMFTAPEIINISYRNLLRTLENEYYTIAVLLYLLLMNGKHPYNNKALLVTPEQIKNGQFINYSPGNNNNQPDNEGQKLWDTLPPFIKDGFCAVFQKGQEHYLPEKRLNPSEWRDKMEAYYNLLD